MKYTITVKWKNKATPEVWAENLTPFQVKWEIHNLLTEQTSNRIQNVNIAPYKEKPTNDAKGL